MRKTFKSPTTNDIGTLTSAQLDGVSGGMKAEVFVGHIKMTIESDGTSYGVVVRPSFSHVLVSSGGC